MAITEDQNDEANLKLKRDVPAKNLHNSYNENY